MLGAMWRQFQAIRRRSKYEPDWGEAANLSIAKGKCPDCNGQLYEGPGAGMAENVGCPSCGAEWWFAPPFDPKRTGRDARLMYGPDA